MLIWLSSKKHNGSGCQSQGTLAYDGSQQYDYGMFYAQIDQL